MALTPVLGITQVAANQSNKEITINDAIVALEAAGNATKSLDFSLVSTGVVTIDEVAFTRNFMFKCVNAPSDLAGISLTLPRTLNDNPIQRLFVVYNNSGKGLTVTIAGAAAGTSGATGLVLPDGTPRLMAMDGDNLIVASQATTITRFTDLADAPTSYTGKKGMTFAVNAAEDGLEFVEGLTLDGLSDVDVTTNGLADADFLRYNATTKTWQSAAVKLVTSFLGLSDVPQSFYGMAGYLLHVNGASNAIEFVDPKSLGGPVTGGGNTGQVLAKNSATDGDYGWADPAVTLPAGGGAGQYLQKNSSSPNDAKWVDLPVVHELPAAGATGQLLTKSSGTDYAVEWADPLSLTTEYTPAVVNAHAFSLLDNNGLQLPFNPTPGNALVVAYFSNAAVAAAAGWTALATLGATTESAYWVSGGAFAHIVAAGDSVLIEPVAAPGTADAAIVYEIDVRYFKGNLANLAPKLAYNDGNFPSETFNDSATMYLLASAHRVGALPVYTETGGVATTVQNSSSAGTGGNRFAGGLYFQPATKGSTVNVSFDMGGGTDGAIFYLTMPALSTQIEEAPADGQNYVRSMKAWKVQGPALPTGGTKGQVLAKNSATDGDASWEAAPISLPAAGTTGQILAKKSGADGDATWEDAPESLPTGGVAGQVLTKKSGTDGDAEWLTPVSAGAGEPVVVQSATVDEAPSTEAITFAAAPTVGNWLIALTFSNNNGQTANTAAGWEQLGTLASGNWQDVAIFAKQVVEGDTATITPSLTGSAALSITAFELSEAAIGGDISKVLVAASTAGNQDSGTVGPVAITGTSTVLFAFTSRGSSTTPVLTPSATGSVAVTNISGAGSVNRYGSGLSYDYLADGTQLTVGVNEEGGASGAYAYVVLNPLTAAKVGEAPDDGAAYVREGQAWTAAKLSTLADVDTTTTAPSDGQALVWNAAAKKWEPGTVTASSGGGDSSSGSSSTVVSATGTGASQEIALPQSGLSVDDVLVFVNGIRFATTEYTINGQTLTMASNADGDAIQVVYLAGGGGASFLKEAGVPAGTLGNPGDMYLDDVANELYGPKATSAPVRQSGRYWGYIVDVTSSGFISVAELTFSDPDGNKLTPVSATLDNAQSGYAGANAIDGNAGSFASTQTASAQTDASQASLNMGIWVDFGKTVTVDNVTITNRPDSYAVGQSWRNWRLFTSDTAPQTPYTGVTIVHTETGDTWTTSGETNTYSDVNPLTLPTTVWGDPVQLGGIPEAPDDGKFYARQNGAWVAITATAA